MKKRYNQYAEFKREQELTAAVSFLSNKALSKRYKHFFDQVTIGYEVEVAKGAFAFSSESTEINLESLRESFNAEFSWSEGEYLQWLRLDAEQTVNNFELKAVYGEPNEDYLNKMSVDLENLLGLDYRVVGLPMQSGIPIMEEPSVDGNYNTQAERIDFIRDKTRIINLSLTIEKAENILRELITFKNKYTVIPAYIAGFNPTNTKVTRILSSIETLKEYYKENNGDELDIRDEIYSIGKDFLDYKKDYISIIRNLSAQLLKNATPSQNKWVIFNAKGLMTELRTDLYNKSGLLNSLIDWPKSTYEKFIENYNEELIAEKERQWRQYIEDAQNRADDEKDNIIEAIHNLVVKEVDPKAKLAESYHQNQEFKGKYTVVESDSSIEPSGAEIVSPILRGVNSSFKWLDDVFNMIEENGLETNSSTGFHVNIGSFESISQSKTYEPGDRVLNHSIDVVKLALFSGDHYLLEQFDRYGNTYAKSMNLSLNNLKNSNFDFKRVQKEGFNFIKKLNKEFIANQYDRYRTINMQNLLDKNYLEFRIAGGANYHTNREKVKKAIYRYVQLCAIACDPEAYFNEYMKALYQRFIKEDNEVAIEVGRPKNAGEALIYLRRWSNTITDLGAGDSYVFDITSMTKLKTAFTSSNKGGVTEATVMSLIARMNTDKYKFVNTNFLIAVRMLMLWAVDDQTNDPKRYLSNIFKNDIDLIKEDYSKLYRTRPAWVKFFYTGMLNQKLTAGNTMKPIKKIQVQFKKPKEVTPIKSKSNYESIENATGLIPEVIADIIVREEIVLNVLPKRVKDAPKLIKYLAERLVKVYDHNDTFKAKLKKRSGREVAYAFMRHWASAYIKNNWSEEEQKKLGDAFANGEYNTSLKLESADYSVQNSYWITDEGKIIGTADHERTADKYAKDRKETAKVDAWCNKTDGTSVNYAAEKWGWIRIMGGARDNNIAVLIGTNSVAPKAFTKFIDYLNDIPFEGCFIDISKDAETTSQQIKKAEALKTLIRKNSRKAEATAMQLEASGDQTYTNKSKSVKILYYANRSTPQVVKPGQTVKAKAGYGKRTKIRSATADEVAQFKKGKWLRTREDGKAHNAKGAKTSKYRPVLAKKQKDARKRKLAASEGIQYKDFMREVFGK